VLGLRLLPPSAEWLHSVAWQAAWSLTNCLGLQPAAQTLHNSLLLPKHWSLAARVAAAVAATLGVAAVVTSTLPASSCLPCCLALKEGLFEASCEAELASVVVAGRECAGATLAMKSWAGLGDLQGSSCCCLAL
jgi:hypothetical protein